MSINQHVFLAVAIFFGLNGRSLADDAPKIKEKNLPPAADNFDLQSKGYLVPVRTWHVTPEVRGRIVKLAVEEGARVKQGDLIAKLDDRLYSLEVQRTAALVEQARARLDEIKNGPRAIEKKQAELAVREAEERRNQYKTELELLRPLRSSGGITSDTLKKADSQFRIAEVQLEKLRAAQQLLNEGHRSEHLEVAKAELAAATVEHEKAKYLLGCTEIRAPANGTILTKKADVGSVVDPAAFNIPASVCEMADLTEMEVDLWIQERDFSKVYKGQHCKVVPEALRDRTYEGVVSRVLPIADRAKGAIGVRVKIQNVSGGDGEYLRPETAAIVSFLAKK
jgi:multidrug resistance efflux pump